MTYESSGLNRQNVDAVIEAGCISEREHMIYSNMPLVIHIARKFFHSPVEFDDMVSVGYIGLIKAVDTFDPVKGYKFATYASICIRNEILMAIRRENKHRKDLSLDMPVQSLDDYHDIRYGDVIPSGDDVASSVESEIMFKHAMDRISDSLSPLEQKVILMRFAGSKKQTEIARELRRSQSYISRVESKALRKMRGELEAVV